MASLTKGIEVARKLFDQEAFGEMVDKEVFPGRDNTEVSSGETLCRRTLFYALPAFFLPISLVTYIVALLLRQLITVCERQGMHASLPFARTPHARWALPYRAKS